MRRRPRRGDLRRRVRVGAGVRPPRDRTLPRDTHESHDSRVRRRRSSRDHRAAPLVRASVAGAVASRGPGTTERRRSIVESPSGLDRCDDDDAPPCAALARRAAPAASVARPRPVDDGIVTSGTPRFDFPPSTHPGSGRRAVAVPPAGDSPRTISPSAARRRVTQPARASATPGFDDADGCVATGCGWASARRTRGPPIEVDDAIRRRTASVQHAQNPCFRAYARSAYTDCSRESSSSAATAAVIGAHVPSRQKRQKKPPSRRRTRTDGRRRGGRSARRRSRRRRAAAARASGARCARRRTDAVAVGSVSGFREPPRRASRSTPRRSDRSRSARIRRAPRAPRAKHPRRPCSRPTRIPSGSDRVSWTRIRRAAVGDAGSIRSRFSAGDVAIRRSRRPRLERDRVARGDGFDAKRAVRRVVRRRVGAVRADAAGAVHKQPRARRQLEADDRRRRPPGATRRTVGGGDGGDGDEVRRRADACSQRSWDDRCLCRRWRVRLVYAPEAPRRSSRATS